MFRNYYKTTWRNLWKYKFYSLVNIAGLTTGLAIGILILLWVQDELSFDRFHGKAKQIYRLQNQVGTGSSTQIWTVTNAPIAVTAKSRLPEVKEVVRLYNNFFFAGYRYGDKLFAENHAFFTDASLFTVFDFGLIKGNTARPFPDDNSVVLTETTARRYFGNAEPLGKVIVADDSVRFTVSGVVKDFPRNSSITGDLFFPISLLNKDMHNGRVFRDINTLWEEFDYVTFLQVQPGANISALADKLRNIHLQHEPADTDIKYLLQELSGMHLYKADGTDGGIGTVRIFIVIAILILVIACINYVNLSTARSMLRSREVSVRKVLGAGRRQLFLQFFTETVLLFLFASAMALMLIQLLMPLFNRISGKELSLNLADYRIWLVILIAISGTLVVSSIYPALLLSSFEPVKALQGQISGRIGEATFRRILVVGQFAISAALITGTIIISQQLHYIRSKELGYDKTQVFTFSINNMNARYPAFRNELLRKPGITAVTRASGNIVQLGIQSGDNSWDGKQNGQTFMVYPLSIDKDFIPFFKLELLQGRNFSGSPADSAHYILNQTAVREAGIKDPIGKRFRMWGREGTIIGVVKDFHFASMKNKIEPAVLYHRPEFGNALFVKTGSRDAAKAVAAAHSVWDQFSAGRPFSYTFLDETFCQLYRSEQETGTLFNIFSAIAIFISCLGLLGLTAYTAQVRTREIGVRKVLGASVGSIVTLLARDFIRLVLIAILIAVPVSWYVMNKWLDDFAYRIHISWTVFLASGSLAILIAVITISFQSVKAAISNPVKSLRTD